MAVLSSTVQPASDSFKENRSSMFELIDHWRSLEQRTIDASNKRLKTFRAGGNCRLANAWSGCWILECHSYRCLHGQLLR